MLELRHISKRFGSTVALDRVDLRLAAGEVVALMGANGAGKSTLVRIISGVHAPDSGTIALDGRAIAPASPKHAKQLGIVAVHQLVAELNVPGLSVAENLLLDRLCAAGTPVLATASRLRAAAREVAAGIGLEVDPAQRLERLSIAERQLVAIARAVASDPHVLIFDEPTAALSSAEADRLFAVIDRLRDRGVAILYISHRLGDIQRIADRAIVLRDGRIVGEFPKPVDFAQAIQAMIGRAIDRPAHRSDGPGRPLLALDGLRLRPESDAIDLVAHEGEVIAVTGPVGAGKTSLAEIVFGVRPPAAGAMTVDGARWSPSRPSEAIRHGVFLAAEDRWRSSLFPAQVPFASIAGTISFPFLARWFPRGPVGSARERIAAERGIRAFGIKCRGPGDTLAALSGGNQQKVVLARWHAEPARILLLDEPFQGVDIGARDDIIRAIRAGAPGRATLVFVSDYEEALEVADRIVVMRERRIVDDRPRGDFDVAGLLAASGAAEAGP